MKRVFHGLVIITFSLFHLGILYADDDSKYLKKVNTELDGAAQSYGFINYDHFLRASEICNNLIGQISPLYSIEMMTGSDIWKSNLCNKVVQIQSPQPQSPTRSNSTNKIQSSVNDEIFIINNEVFKAKSYCFNMREGDKVEFVEGSKYGACASAVLLNLRTEKLCRVWCE